MSLSRRCKKCHNKLVQSNMSSKILYCNKCMMQYDRDILEKEEELKENN